jgi:sortase A
MAKRILAVACIILGIGIFLYPTINDRYENYQQQKVLSEWQDNFNNIDQSESETDTVPAVNEIPVPTGSTPKQLQTEPVVKTNPSKADAEGVLIIDKINLKLPILTGATVKNMLISVSSIAHTGKAGAVGNYAIAGHRNRTYGKNFNRLDEVKVGDLIQVDTGSKLYTYKVQSKLYVKPADVWVLEGNGKDREITLITCNPMKNPTQRLVVKGKLVDS